MKTYISGKITGLPIETALHNFAQAKEYISKQGHEPINPMEVLPYAEHLTWKDYMISDIKALLVCDAIYMLDNWQDSKGARLEYEIAKGLGLAIIHSTNAEFAFSCIDKGIYNLITLVCEDCGVCVSKINSRNKKWEFVEARAMINYIAFNHYRLSIRKYASLFGLDFCGASQTLKRFVDRLDTEPELKQRVISLLQKI